MGESVQSQDLNQIAAEIAVLSDGASPDTPYIIAVGGPSGSGKSTIAAELQNTLPNSSLVNMDRYLSEKLWDSSRKFNHESPDPSRPYVGGISPEIWDMRLMEAHLVALSRGETVTMPIFDETIKDRIGYEPFTPKTRIVIEGGHSFSDPFASLSEYKVLVDATLHARLMRKLYRSCVRYGLDEGDEVLGRYLTKDEPVHRYYLEERKQAASAILHNAFSPVNEFTQSMSADTSADETPASILRPVAETGELDTSERLTVRQRDGLWLSYDVLTRPVFTVPIAVKTLDLLLKHYEEAEAA